MLNRLPKTKPKTDPGITTITHSRNNLRPAPHHHYHPLLLPEILEIIFSFLKPASIRAIAAVVCKQWYKVAIWSAPQTTHWNDTFTSSEWSQFLERLDRSNGLSLAVGSRGASEGARLHGAAWDGLLTDVERVVQKGGSRIQKIETSGSIPLEVNLCLLLNFLGSLLTEIKMEGFKDEILDVDLVLTRCVNLKSLYVASEGHSSKLGELMHAEKSRVSVGLQSLDFRTITVDQLALEALVRICPRLTRLDLVSCLAVPSQDFSLNQENHIGSADHSSHPLSGTQVFDRITFHAFLVQHCPRLVHVGLHFHNSPLLAAMALDLAHHFPRLDSMQFSAIELSFHNFQRALFPILEHQLTTLELNHKRFTKDFAKNLHEILCTCPNLLHLKALSMIYLAEYMDLAGDVSILDGRYRPQLVINRQVANKNGGYPQSTLPLLFEPRIRKRVWVCQRLRTLHLSIAGMRGDSRDAYSSRIMFAYLVTVCPKLEDICLFRSALNLSLEGGMCLLTGLKKLRKLDLRTDVIMGMARKDVSWLGFSKTIKTRVGVLERMELKLLILTLKKAVKEEEEAEHARKEKVKEAGRYVDYHLDAGGSEQALGDEGRPGSESLEIIDQSLIRPMDVPRAYPLSKVLETVEGLLASDALCFPHLEMLALRPDRDGGMFMTRKLILEFLYKFRKDIDFQASPGDYPWGR